MRSKVHASTGRRLVRWPSRQPHTVHVRTLITVFGKIKTRKFVRVEINVKECLKGYLGNAQEYEGVCAKKKN